MDDERLVATITAELKTFQNNQVKQTLMMLDQGDTVPFIARYRKERTHNLDEVQIRKIQEVAHKVRTLEAKKQSTIIKIEEQGKLTPQLQSQILQATTQQKIDDLYLPFKQKRRTKAMEAREQGLQPLADKVWQFDAKLADAINKFAEQHSQIGGVAEVKAGIIEIVAENISERVAFREWIRKTTYEQGLLEVTAKKQADKLDELGVFKQYYEFSQRLKDLPSYRVLAINRGESQKVLGVKITIPETVIYNYLTKQLIKKPHSLAATLITAAQEQAYSRFIKPAIERELKKQLTQGAEEHAIEVFGDNLYHLLMQAPLKGRVVMGFDPAYRTGCKLAVIDENGKLLAKKVIYPHKPASADKRAAAKNELIEFINQYQVAMIAIGNGTASRESEQFVAAAIKEIKTPIFYVIVNEAGASVYSASDNAREEFPDLSVEQRSAISIGRRVQDPLAELVKIDPKSIGVGQYQHDVSQSQLNSKLDQVIETAVNQVGINLNTASSELLGHISGLTKTTAKNIVQFRNTNGKFENRLALKQVARLGNKAFEQSVGFLRIIDGDNPLDNTDIHPESYAVTEQLLQLNGLSLADLGTTKAQAKLQSINVPELAERLNVGVATLTDIIKGIVTPGRDVRDDMPQPLLRQDVLTIEDLKPQMKLQGTVRNIVDFGAFVDIGVKHDGLVHISKMSHHFVKDPLRIVSIGDIVTVWIDSVDVSRDRIQLTMLNPNKNDDK